MGFTQAASKEGFAAPSAKPQRAEAEETQHPNQLPAGCEMESTQSCSPGQDEEAVPRINKSQFPG